MVTACNYAVRQSVSNSTTPLSPPHTMYCNMYLQTKFQRVLSNRLRAVLNDWDGEESWAYVNSHTEILAIAAHSRLQELGLLKK